MAVNLRALFLLARDSGTCVGRRAVRRGDRRLRSARALAGLFRALRIEGRSAVHSQSPGEGHGAGLPGERSSSRPRPGPDGTPDSQLAAIAERTLLGRMGEPHHVAQAVEFLLTCDYATGAVVDITAAPSVATARRLNPLEKGRRLTCLFVSSEGIASAPATCIGGRPGRKPKIARGSASARTCRATGTITSSG